MIAANGLKFVLTGAALTVVLILLAAGKDSFLLLIFSALTALLTIFLTFFYRSPHRTIPSDRTLVLSIADGKVLAINETSHPFIGGKGHKVSIFLSVFDVHINRAPLDGTIEYVNYNPGKFFAAFKDKASEENEQTEIGLSFPSGKMIFKQIAGVLARRIVCRLKPQQSVRAGEIFGLIHFGSRAELFLPDQVEILVEPGDRVKAGETAIARVRN